MKKCPLKILIGGNKGFRRAASITSVEPGVTYKMKKTLVFVYIAVPFKRNIIQNIENNMTPGGFADYLIFVETQFKL